MKNWMEALALHYESTRKRHAHDRLIILFDIDGTILDMRYVVFYVLRALDKRHGTSIFKDLTIDEMDFHEDDVEHFLDKLNVEPADKVKLAASYREELWSSTAAMEAHTPIEGVFDVIRWFQGQYRVSVGLNTGRPEELRENTLKSLNLLGRKYGISFENELLYMKPSGWTRGITEAKADGLRHFRDRGYRIFAFIDNEPENLKAIAHADSHREILLLHADTIYRSNWIDLHLHTVQGSVYDFALFVRQWARTVSGSYGALPGTSS